MVELNTRDLVVLYCITTWNESENRRTSHIPANARASVQRPCTITVLCGKKEPGGGIVNKYIVDHSLNIELADDSEQVYRATQRLALGGLIYSGTVARQQYAQTPLGTQLVNSIRTTPPSRWPGKVKVDGNQISLPASLIAG